MNIPSTSQRPGESGRMDGLVRLIRQVCLLREQGDAAGATLLQEAGVTDAVRDLRLAQGPEALSESELRALFTTEERRVAEAAILSELLLARLVEHLPADTVARRSRHARSTPAPRPDSPVAASGPPAITDLLDAMLAAERPGRRPAAAIHRES